MASRLDSRSKYRGSIPRILTTTVIAMTKTMKIITDKAPHGHHKGGQSAQRFERNREIAKHEYLKRVGNAINEHFDGMERLDGLLVGGPGFLKEELVKGKYIKPDLVKKIIAVVDTGDGGEIGMRELVQKSSEYIKENELVKERDLVQSFLSSISRDDGMVEYGIDDVKNALVAGQASKVLASEAIDPAVMDEIDALSKASGSGIIIVSVDTEEGKMFNDTFGGIGAFLRWRRPA